MNRFRENLGRFMVGRYGYDRLGRFIMGAAVAFIVIGLFVRGPWPDAAAVICLVLCYFRMFSKNVRKRFEENQKFERIWFRISEKIKKWRFNLRQFREYHIYKCPGCGQKIRVPRGKGKVSIHCPKCSTDFIKKS